MAKAKKKAPAAPAKATASAVERVALLDMPLDDLRQHVAALRGSVKGVGRQVARTERMTTDQRIHSTGRLRDGEPPIMTGIFDMMDAHPSVFQSLAGKDRGKDPKLLETDPARDDLERRAILLPLLADIDTLREGVGDTILRAAERARALSSAGYQIALANEEHDEDLRNDLAPAKSYYGDNARRGAKTLKKKKAAAKRKAAGDGT